MANTSVTSLIEDIVRAGKAHDNNAPGSRETLVDLGHSLVAALEIPSEFVQRSMWAEVSKLLFLRSHWVHVLIKILQPALSGINRMGVEWKLFQHLRNAGKLPTHLARLGTAMPGVYEHC